MASEGVVVDPVCASSCYRPSVVCFSDAVEVAMSGQRQRGVSGRGSGEQSDVVSAKGKGKPETRARVPVLCGEKPYGCSLCEYHCADKSNLMRHERIHSGEKPYGCSLCEFRCSRMSTLVVHERVHSGE